MAMWNPWRGCHRYSEGCKYCYIHKGDARRGVDTGTIIKTKGFDAPVQVKQDGTYRMKGGQLVYLCFSTDFLIEDADPWRGECWEMIRRRPDLHFLFLTKRIQRFLECVPSDWGQGYDNVTVVFAPWRIRSAQMPVFLYSHNSPSDIRTSFASR